MLTRWVNVKSGGQTVQFKYTKFEDFQRLLDRRRAEVGTREKGRKELTSEIDLRNLDYDVQRLTVLSKVNQQAITDLKQARLILVGMHKAFLRAREAAVKSARAFQGAHQALTEKLKSGSGAVRIADPVLATLIPVIGKYFGGTTTPAHFTKIRTVFEKPAQGLSSNHLVIADCAGRELDPQGAELAEGIVPLKRDSQIKQDVEYEKLMKDVREQRSFIGQNYHGEEYARRIKEVNDQLKDAEMYLTQKYLAGGDSRSIHIQFSYCAKRSTDSMARAIVHEATHKFAATVDWGYVDQGKVGDLPPERAIDNADSYAFAALSILRNQLTTPEALGREPPAVDQASLDHLQNGVEVKFKKNKGP
jgi:hypothetical protein